MAQQLQHLEAYFGAVSSSSGAVNTGSSSSGVNTGSSSSGVVSGFPGPFAPSPEQMMMLLMMNYSAAAHGMMPTITPESAAAPGQVPGLLPTALPASLSGAGPPQPLAPHPVPREQPAAPASPMGNCRTV
jgi:hypothetical protein